MDSAATPESYTFNQKLCLTIISSRGKIPSPISKMFPGMTIEKFNHKKADPLFLYESMKMCSNCYNFIKVLVEKMNS